MIRLFVCFLLISGASFSTAARSTEAKPAQVLELKIGKKGFEPSELKIEKSKLVLLKVTRTTDVTCAKSIEIPELGVKQELPELNKTYEVSFVAKSEGKLKFGCSMDQMLKGFLIVE